MMRNKPKSNKLTENQFKTIDILRSLAKKEQKERLEKLKLASKQRPQKKPADSEENKNEIDTEELGSTISALQKRKYSLDTRMPLHVSEKAKRFLKLLEKKEDIVKFSFSDGFANGAKVVGVTSQNKKVELGVIEVKPIRNPLNESGTQFGLSIDIDQKEKNLSFIFRYPATPGALASPSQKNQGGLTTRLRGGK